MKFLGEVFDGNGDPDASTHLVPRCIDASDGPDASAHLEIYMSGFMLLAVFHPSKSRGLDWGGRCSGGGSG